MIPIQKDCQIENINIDFKAPFKYCCQIWSLNKGENSIVPKYLSDQNYYTPAFILPREKVFWRNM